MKVGELIEKLYKLQEGTEIEVCEYDAGYNPEGLECTCGSTWSPNFEIVKAKWGKSYRLQVIY